MKNIHFRAFHFSDTHFSPLNRSPQSRSASYNDDVEFELNSFGEIIQQEKPDCLLFSGDFWHIKNQEAYSPGDVNHYSKFLRKWNVPIFAVCGNHDLPKSSYDMVEKTAYRTLSMTVPKFVDVKSPIITNYETPIGPVIIAGVPYFPLSILFDKLAELDKELEKIQGFKIVLLHPDAIPKSELSIHFPVCSWNDLCVAIPHTHLLCLGHIHQSFEVYSGISPLTGEPQFISKPWSFGRVVKDYYQSTEILEHRHKPSYCDIQLFSEDNGPLQVHLEYKIIPHKPFEHIFNRDALSKEIENSGQISRFISTLREEYGSVDNAFQIENPEEYLAKANIPDSIREIINHYLSE